MPAQRLILHTDSPLAPLCVDEPGRRAVWGPHRSEGIETGHIRCTKARLPLSHEFLQTWIGHCLTDDGLRWPQFCNDLAAGCDEHTLTGPHKANIGTETVFEFANANGFHRHMVATCGYQCKPYQGDES
jgi:hypothetical protein